MLKPTPLTNNIRELSHSQNFLKNSTEPDNILVSQITILEYQPSVIL